MQNLVIPNLPEPLAVVCHDAGATNIILAWLRTIPTISRRVFIQGPAIKLWSATFPDEPLDDNLNAVLKDAATLLSGTGWSSDLEHKSRRIAQEYGISSIAVVDHWVNYAERFCRDGIQVLPNEMWVTDEYALAKAKHCFPEQKIYLQPNLYLIEQLRCIPSIDTVVTPELLYILEPTRNEWGRDTPGEFQALDYFITQLPSLNLPSSCIIHLRPHPSDPSGKYSDWIFCQKQKGYRIILDETVSISEAIGRARWVAGCESFALVLALEAKREVFCTLPPWAHSCRLPHQGLIHLKNSE